MLCSHTTRPARLDRERHSVPSLGGFPAKTERGRCKQRRAYDLVELRLVAMPTDFGTVDVR